MIAVVEMPRGTQYKYEVPKNPVFGLQAAAYLKLDRVLEHAVPENYGFIMDTLAQDGDPLDVFIVSGEPIPPLTHVEIEIVDAYHCVDNGEPDEKIIARIKGDPTLSREWVESTMGLQSILSYLQDYKPGFEVGPRLGRKAAEELVEKYRKAFFGAQRNTHPEQYGE